MASFRVREGRPNPFQARVVGSEGRVIAKSFRNMTDAKRWAHSVEVDVQRGDFLASTAGDRRFDRYADGWLTQRQRTLAPGTWNRDASYLRSLILPTFGALRVRAITSTDVSQWLSELDNAESTKAKALQIVRGVLDHARRDNAIRSNPVEDLASRPSPTRNTRRGRALTDVELASLMAGAVEVGNPLIIVAMARMGLRIGEALGLRRGDFDTGAAILSVERSRDRDGSIRPLKGKEEGDRRTLPMPPDVVEAFLSHTTGAGPLPITGDLFITRRGTPLQYNNWRRSFWLPTVKEAALVDVVPHDLRKTCVTRLFVVDKWSPAEVQAFVGHSDARMTLGVYARVNTQDLPVPSTFEGAL